MTKSTGIPKRWRPRFSLRTLVLFMTLVCVYFGAWEATKRYAAAINRRDTRVFSPVPFIVRREEVTVSSPIVKGRLDEIVLRSWQMWFFGLKGKWHESHPGDIVITTTDE